MKAGEFLIKVENLASLPFWGAAVINGLLAKDLIDVTLKNGCFCILRFI